ncbi:MAG: hypothetical protein M3P18_09190 [Actinomycetota bacterium]|nr:hypothetical protein [Actinomycetota bacterium]
MYTVRLSCARHRFWVEVRVAGMNGRWIASADTPDGPSLGLAFTPHRALVLALEPFDGVIPELMATAPPELLDHGAMGY